MDQAHYNFQTGGGGTTFSAQSPAGFPYHFRHRRMMMHMTFYWGTDAIVLFERWPGRSIKMYILSLLLTFGLCLIIEFLSHCRLIRSNNQATAHVIKTMMHAVRMGVAYMAMLAVMSFNVGVLLAAVAGHGFGFLLFATRLSSSTSKAAAVGNQSSETRGLGLPPMSC